MGFEFKRPALCDKDVELIHFHFFVMGNNEEI